MDIQDKKKKKKQKRKTKRDVLKEKLGGTHRKRKGLQEWFKNWKKERTDFVYWLNCSVSINSGGIYITGLNRIERGGGIQHKGDINAVKF